LIGGFFAAQAQVQQQRAEEAIRLQSLETNLRNSAPIMDEARMTPIPIKPGTEITVQQAAAWAGLSEDTVRRRARADGLGHQPGGRGRMIISAPAWSAYVVDDREALAAIRLGDLDHPSVRPHLERRFEMGVRQ